MKSSSNNRFRVIWYGIPAQPVNRHLFAPKPVGQARKDCRTNSRHLLYSSIQQTMCRKFGSSSGGETTETNNNNNIPFVDAFALSAGLSFTSLDGAHYYSFARDAMIDSLGEELGKLPIF